MPENYIARQDEHGSINISEDVIAVMVAAAASEVDGVAGLANTIGTDLAEFLGRKSVSKGVKVQFVEDKIVVDVVVIVRFGVKINEVGVKIQEAVAGAVESTWSTASTQIKSVVDNVVFPAIDLILAVFFFAKLGTAYFEYRKSGQFEWAAPAILFACLVFTLTAPMYLWSIIGI